jgi:para-aminobenzoate synthetase component 1
VLGQHSYFAADPVSVVSGDAVKWPSARAQLRATLDAASPHDDDLPPFQGGWMGWLSYELGRAFDRMPVHESDPFKTPDFALGLYDWVIAWDHHTSRCWLISTGVDAEGRRDDRRGQVRADEVMARVAVPPATPPEPTLIPVADACAGLPPGLRTDFTPAEYRAAVAQVIEHVLAGDIFQANLTQRFTAPFTGEAITLLASLERWAPAPLGAYLRHDDIELFSASPEQFLRYDPRTRIVQTRPIKGTRRRDPEPQRDAALARELAASEKDRAENVMIVDLLRNDLSRVCEPGSVTVDALCRLESHVTVHHLVSVVTGRLRSGSDALDLLAATYPGGSVTGAPKLRAMALLAGLERVRRGIYTGAIGWLGLDGALNTNLAIRTIVVKRGVAAVHAGGGVTARSDPDEEYRETLDKARALLHALADAT